MIAVMLLMATVVSADPIDDIRRAQELNEWIHESVPYVVSKSDVLSPWETIRNGGDCADMSALLVHMLKQEGIPARMVVILPKGEPHHAYVEVWGMVVDPVSGGMFGEFPIPHKIVRTIGLAYLLWDWERQIVAKKREIKRDDG